MKKILFAGLCCVLLALAACASKDNTMPPSPLVSFTPTLQVGNLWSQSVGGGTDNSYLRMSPVVIGQVVYAADYSGRVAAFDAASGRVLWRVQVAVPLTTSIAVDAGKLFIGTNEGGVIALDQSNGQALWMTAVGNDVLATPCAAKGRVIVKSIDGSVTALSEADGRQLWHYAENMPPLILHADSQPQVVGNFAVIGFADGKLVVLRANSGRVVWARQIAVSKGSTDIERMVDIDVNPIVKNGVVFAATYQGKLAALNLRSGRLLWEHSISSYAGIAADAHHLYLSDANSHVWAFDLQSGAVNWRQTQLAYRMITGPVVMGQYIAVADREGYLHWLSSRDGHMVARAGVSRAGVLGTPTVSGNRLFALTSEGGLFAFGI
ncbi:MAG: outer membrane protein assembly factor BamB [Pseudomonadota bacterium]|nr:outer membrane protein assembly factor BamB [Gammaproteobacteria bacterium]MBU1559013.1 outer membrane protein assembly factor BamB [Gammaproteobacteria bacterium]MBU1629189.1 outer membrane protein assembly factor BamB [Gammaproteobacteria bacterium]MBU1927355.1 outer membrane protein assembly factor BamB [Gammaproteobacteria bacterium]MBU2545932.1 outer membrane protein assembly factor BamB [Gammaproteobacteria bacterium]